MAIWTKNHQQTTTTTTTATTHCHSSRLADLGSTDPRSHLVPPRLLDSGPMGLGGELVAVWEVPLSDGLHKVGFEHGTTTGRRVLWVDGKVNGKSYKKFTENQSKILKTWLFPLEGALTRVVLEKDTLDVWVNGNRLDTAGEFVDDGTETHFDLSGHPAYIRAVSSGNRREGLIHSLVVDDVEIPEAVE
ncbi:fas apoptotic inhibitory molecule 1-like isoform X2 [Portunus trituberculatus]|uniref:fas apoptotic inhibitory molecule 1-like isoform X2 n=1 Tax=Portunus trituberculatus TaxID=210409 RepID=UPI001E1CF036|nr:fas apoptotic inhibitory molecule 1-like isoform X2 [Portunus trituberculatus]